MRTLFIFALFLSPLFVMAGDPVLVECDCKTEEKGVKALGLLRQYHEMLSALEKSGQKKAIESLLMFYSLKIDLPIKQQVQDTLLIYCLQIVGDNVNAFLREAQELDLLQEKKLPAEISDTDVYKARLACIAVKARRDTLPPQTDTAEIEEKINILEENVGLWRMLGIGALAALLALAGIFVIYERKRKKKDAELRKPLQDNLNEIESDNLKLKEENAKLDADLALWKRNAISVRPPSAGLVQEENKVNNDLSPAPVVLPKKIYYAGLPSGSLLYRVSDTFEPQSTYFVIEVNSNVPHKGKLSLVEDEMTRLHAFSMIDSLRDACELLSTGAPTSARLLSEIPGQVEFEGGHWNITDKIKLTW